MRSRLLLSAVVIAVLAPLSVFATPVTGELAFSGNVNATITSLNFCTGDTSSTCSSGQGNIGVLIGTGSFAGLPGSVGQIKDISNSSTPPGQMVSLANFLTLANGDTFTLTELNIGTGGACPPAPGATCTPTSPLLVTSSNPSGKTATIFSDSAAGAIASFSVNADAVVTSPAGATTPYTGTFSATFNGMTTADVLATLASSGSLFTSYSATFTPVPTTSTVPEPGTAWFAIAGLLFLVGAGAFRRFAHC